jgi:hypothetical protein
MYLVTNVCDACQNGDASRQWCVGNKHRQGHVWNVGHFAHVGHTYSLCRSPFGHIKSGHPPICARVLVVEPAFWCHTLHRNGIRVKAQLRITKQWLCHLLWYSCGLLSRNRLSAMVMLMLLPLQACFGLCTCESCAVMNSPGFVITCTPGP